MGTIVISGDNVVMNYGLEIEDTLRIAGESCMVQNYTFVETGKLDIDQDMAVKNSIFDDADNIDLAPGKTLTAVNCCFGLSKAAIEAAGGTIIDADCLFSMDLAFGVVNGKNYYPYADSPCVDAGIDVGLSEDLDGEAVGSPPNIGCYESIATLGLAARRFVTKNRQRCYKVNTMPNFQGSKEIIVQPYDEVTYEFEVTACSAAAANDGMLAYGDGISSFTAKVHNEDGDDKTSEMVASSSEASNVISVKIRYPSTSGPGKYHLTLEIDTDNGDKVELDFNRIRAVDL